MGDWYMGDVGKTRRFANKKHFDDAPAQLEHVKAAVLDLTKVPDDRFRSLCVEDIGKLHFPPTYSGAYEHSAGKRMYPVKPSGHAEPKGKKPIKVPPAKHDDKPRGKRDNIYQRTRRGVELGLDELTPDWNHKRVVKQGLDFSGPPCRQRVSKEYEMEKAINRKQRFNGDGLDPMNQSSVYYSLAGTREVQFKPRGRYRENNQNPEYSVGYFAQGGLIPGSSIQIRQSGKKSLRQSNPIGEDTGGKKGMMKTYKEIEAERAHKYDLDQVAFLTMPTEKLGRRVPSWEERTGLYLVKPEDEKD
jgi:hypothetical protein